MKFRILPFAALLAVMMFGVADLRAQGGGSNLPFEFGPNNLGKEFYFAMPANWDLPGSETYYVRLYITSSVRTQVKVSTGPGVKSVFYTVPNDIVTLDLTPIEAQMFIRNDQPPVPPDRIFKNRAVHIEAKDPIVVYAMNRTTYTSDGMLLLPVNALGKNYIVASYAAVIGVTQELPSQYMVIAPHNGTTVTLYHPHRTPNHEAGETFTIDLDKGDVFTAMSVGYGGDLSGAVITSNKPVAVTAGQNCTYIPNVLNMCCCDHLTEMMLPTEAWGKTYHSVPFQTRQKGDFYRVFAREENTTVYINGTEMAKLNSIGGVEGTGWFEYRALGKDVVEITADKPIYVAQYNTSQSYDNVPSDPFYLVLTPVEQYSKHLFFCTPAADFPRNFLNIVSEKDSYFGLEISNADSNNWRPVYTLAGAGVPREFISTIDGKKYIGVSVEVDPGSYHLRSTESFAAYIYGFGNFDSYGYPVGALTHDLDIPTGAAPSMVNTPPGCSGVATGNITSRAMKGDELAPLSIVTLDPVASSNYLLELLDFEPGVSTAVQYTLTPVDANQPAVAVIAAADMGGNLTFDTIRHTPGGAGGVLDARGDNLMFSVTPSVSSTQMTTLKNLESSPVLITEIRLEHGDRGFTLTPIPVPHVLYEAGASGHTLDIRVDFVASAKGNYTDALIITEQCGRTSRIELNSVVSDNPSSVPVEISGISLLNVAPNPASGDEAVLRFTMHGKGAVAATIVDAAGREVRKVADALVLEHGAQELKLDISGIAAGTYFARIVSEGRTVTVPFVVAR